MNNKFFPYYPILVGFLVIAIVAIAAPPPVPMNGGRLLIKHTGKASFVVTPTPTNLIVTVHIQIPYAIQQSSDFQSWTLVTNVWFSDVSFTVPNNGTNMNFRGCWNSAPKPVITTNSP